LKDGRALQARTAARVMRTIFAVGVKGLDSTQYCNAILKMFIVKRLQVDEKSVRSEVKTGGGDRTIFSLSRQPVRPPYIEEEKDRVQLPDDLASVLWRSLPLPS
jgi:hypothetical protein